MHQRRGDKRYSFGHIKIAKPKVESKPRQKIKKIKKKRPLGLPK